MGKGAEGRCDACGWGKWCREEVGDTEVMGWELEGGFVVSKDFVKGWFRGWGWRWAVDGGSSSTCHSACR